MSIGITGLCIKAAEDDDTVLYTYSGVNHRDSVELCGDLHAQDGLFLISKRCLEKAEIRTKRKRTKNGRKVFVEKRIYHSPDISRHKENGDIQLLKPCCIDGLSPEWLAFRLIDQIFMAYQHTDTLPEREYLLM